MIYINYIYEEERWKDIVDVKIKDCYEVSDRGRVRNKYTGYVLSQMIGVDGYYRLNLQKKNSYKSNCARRVNRLVLKAFNPIKNCDRLVANHLDTNKLNNVLTNLEWCTQEENLLHAKNLGLLNIAKGEFAPKSIHSDIDAAHICILLKQKYSITEILNKLDWENTRSTRRFIQDIRSLKIYTHISKTYGLTEYTPEKIPLTSDIVESICELLDNNNSYSEIINSLGLPNTNSVISTLSSIKRGVIFKDISSKYSFNKESYYKKRDIAYVHEVCKLLEFGNTSKQILSSLNLPITKNELHFISKVRNKLAFTTISSEYNI